MPGKSKIITTNHNGMKLKAEITYQDGSSIAIKTLYPDFGITKAAHIPTFARKFKSFHGTAGVRSAVNLLKSCFD